MGRPAAPGKKLAKDKRDLESAGALPKPASSFFEVVSGTKEVIEEHTQ